MSDSLLWLFCLGISIFAVLVAHWWQNRLQRRIADAERRYEEAFCRGDLAAMIREADTLDDLRRRVR